MVKGRAVYGERRKILALQRPSDDLALLLDNMAKRRVDVVIKKAHPILSYGMRQDLLFEFERFCRIEIKSRDPGHRQMMLHRNKVGKSINRFAATRQFPRLHRFGMAAFLLDAQSVDNLI